MELAYILSVSLSLLHKIPDESNYIPTIYSPPICTVPTSYLIFIVASYRFALSTYDYVHVRVFSTVHRIAEPSASKRSKFHQIHLVYYLSRPSAFD